MCLPFQMWSLSKNDDGDISDDKSILLFYKNYNINNPVFLKKPLGLMSCYTQACKCFLQLLKLIKAEEI